MSEGWERTVEAKRSVSRMDELAGRLAVGVLVGSVRLEGSSWGGGMGPDGREPSSGNLEVSKRRLERVGDDGVEMVWTVSGGGVGQAVEAAMADARSVSRDVGAAGLGRFSAGAEGRDGIEVRGLMTWGAVGRRLGKGEVLEALRDGRWV